jgi:hypothetical protein
MIPDLATRYKIIPELLHSCLTENCRLWANIFKLFTNSTLCSTSATSLSPAARKML